jgi:DNA recombination protein RmuC
MDSATLLTIIIIAVFVIGIIYLLKFFSNKKNAISEEDKAKIEKFPLLEYQVTSLTNQNNDLTQQIALLREEINNLQKQNSALEASLKMLETERENEKKVFEERYKQREAELLALLKKEENMVESLKEQFKNISQEILKTNVKDLEKENAEKLSTILNPFKEKIDELRKDFEAKIIQQFKEQSSLKEQLNLLHELNKSLSEEAHQLTTALKGDTKKQGTWGELVLERVLEASGLQKGKEYETQKKFQNIEGKSVVLDAIVYLPENKHLIIDSKVSLTAYKNYVNTEDQQKMQEYLSDHLTSMSNHIKSLAGKAYYSVSELNTPDYVLMFVPIESAFGVAMRAKPEIFEEGWKNGVVIVTPSTLLATLKTIETMWRIEKQNINAKKVFESVSKIYNKFVGFLEDIENIERTMNTLNNHFDNAKKKLFTGKGNLIRQMENLKKMGASTTKKLPGRYQDALLYELNSSDDLTKQDSSFNDVEDEQDEI